MIKQLMGFILILIKSNFYFKFKYRDIWFSNRIIEDRDGMLIKTIIVLHMIRIYTFLFLL